jgi:hypothetical protein
MLGWFAGTYALAFLCSWLEELFLLSRTAAEPRWLLLALRADVNTTWTNASVSLRENKNKKRKTLKTSESEIRSY